MARVGRTMMVISSKFVYLPWKLATRFFQSVIMHFRYSSVMAVRSSNGWPRALDASTMCPLPGRSSIGRS